MKGITAAVLAVALVTLGFPAAIIALVVLVALPGAEPGLLTTVNGTTAATSGCFDPSTGPVSGLTAEQAAHARVIVAVGQQHRVPQSGLLIALMTAAQESRLRNLDHGDRDSLGLFQQRPSMGWGTAGQLLDPIYAAAAFYGGPGSPTTNAGLLNVPGWQQMTPTAAAQTVQRSGHPTAYAKWETAATRWLTEILAAPNDLEARCGHGSSAQAAIVIEAAARWLGTPYAWGGGNERGPTRGIAHGANTVGFDCSGLTRYAYAQVGIDLPRVAAAQYKAAGLQIGSMSDLRPGDLIFFARNTGDPATIHHVAIWLGDDAMLEAPRTGDVVKVSTRISENTYRVREFIGGLRPTG